MKITVGRSAYLYTNSVHRREFGPQRPPEWASSSPARVQRRSSLDPNRRVCARARSEDDFLKFNKLDKTRFLLVVRYEIAVSAGPPSVRAYPYRFPSPLQPPALPPTRYFSCVFTRASPLSPKSCGHTTGFCCKSTTLIHGPCSSSVLHPSTCLPIRRLGHFVFTFLFVTMRARPLRGIYIII